MWRLLITLIFLLPGILGAKGAVAQSTPSPDVSRFEHPRFGFTAEWSGPWSGPTEITDAEAGLEGIILGTGTFGVLIAGMPAETAVEVIQLTIARQQEEVPETRVIAQEEQGEAATATLEYDSPEGARRAYIEARPLESGDAMLLAGLDGPEDGFDLAFSEAQETIELDGAPLFSGAPYNHPRSNSSSTGANASMPAGVFGSSQTWT